MILIRRWVVKIRLERRRKCGTQLRETGDLLYLAYLAMLLYNGAHCGLGVPYFRTRMHNVP